MPPPNAQNSKVPRMFVGSGTAVAVPVLKERSSYTKEAAPLVSVRVTFAMLFEPEVKLRFPYAPADVLTIDVPSNVLLLSKACSWKTPLSPPPEEKIEKSLIAVPKVRTSGSCGVPPVCRAPTACGAKPKKLRPLRASTPKLLSRSNIAPPSLGPVELLKVTPNKLYRLVRAVVWLNKGGADKALPLASVSKLIEIA
jgi:hypothetical protein